MRRLGILGAILVLGLLAWDLSRPPESQVTARLEQAAIDLYQATLSGRLSVNCRFQPSCSHYAEAVIARDGALVGTARTLWRLARCGPWTPRGTVDPP